MTLLMRDRQNKSKGAQLIQELLKVIPYGTEDYKNLSKASFDELEDLAEKYGIEEDVLQ